MTKEKVLVALWVLGGLAIIYMAGFAHGVLYAS